MSNFEKSMSEIFDVVSTPKDTSITSVVKKQQLPTTVSVENLEEDLVDAYEQTKSNLQDLIDQGKDAMDEILLIAKNGQHPRAFEVYGTLLKNVVEANRELLSVQRQMRDMDKKNQSNPTATTIDKAIFIGSTSELNKLIKGKE
jgi:hypothetical protein